MKIFVAGAAGAVGRILLPKLVQAGHEVVGTTRNERNEEVIQTAGARAVLVDAFDREAVMSAVQEARPDAVIHQLTALSERDFAETSRLRIEGTRNLVDAALSAGARRMIAQSISFVYEPGPGPATEEVPLDLQAPEPRKGLVDSIAVLEQAVSEMPEHVILRYGLFYGPGTWYSREGYMAEQVIRKQLPATEGVSSFVHVEDAAEAALQALKWPSGPVNIVDDEPAKGIDWLPVFAEAIGAPRPDMEPGAGRGERGASNAKARRAYGWVPFFPSWRTSLGRE